MAGWLGQRGVARLRAHIRPGHAASVLVACALGLAPTATIIDGERRWEGTLPSE